MVKSDLFNGEDFCCKVNCNTANNSVDEENDEDESGPQSMWEENASSATMGMIGDQNRNDSGFSSTSSSSGGAAAMVGHRHHYSSGGVMLSPTGGGGCSNGSSSGNNGGVLPVDDKRLRRQIANCNERRRMQSINAGFQALRQLLPHKDGEKMSKAAILQQTADFIHNLQLEKDRLAEENEMIARAKKRRIERSSTIAEEKMDTSDEMSDVVQKQMNGAIDGDVDNSGREMGRNNNNNNCSDVLDCLSTIEELKRALMREQQLRMVYERELVEVRHKTTNSTAIVFGGTNESSTFVTNNSSALSNASTLVSAPSTLHASNVLTNLGHQLSAEDQQRLLGAGTNLLSTPISQPTTTTVNALANGYQQILFNCPSHQNSSASTDSSSSSSSSSLVRSALSAISSLQDALNPLLPSSITQQLNASPTTIMTTQPATAVTLPVILQSAPVNGSQNVSSGGGGLLTTAIAPPLAHSTIIVNDQHHRLLAVNGSSHLTLPNCNHGNGEFDGGDGSAFTSTTIANYPNGGLVTAVAPPPQSRIVLDVGVVNAAANRLMTTLSQHSSHQHQPQQPAPVHRSYYHQPNSLIIDTSQLNSISSLNSSNSNSFNSSSGMSTNHHSGSFAGRPSTTSPPQQSYTATTEHLLMRVVDAKNSPTENDANITPKIMHPGSDSSSNEVMASVAPTPSGVGQSDDYSTNSSGVNSVSGNASIAHRNLQAIIEAIRHIEGGSMATSAAVAAATAIGNSSSSSPCSQASDLLVR